MKTCRGWRCIECQTIVLDRRRKPPPFCPFCKEEYKGQFDEEPLTVARLDKHDFPPKIVENPGQQKLPFQEQGLF
jgi:hypothetical protein